MTSRWDEVSAVTERICEQVSRQPYLTLGLAGALGYFVGRGVPMGVAATLFGVSARTALGSAVERFLRDPSAGGRENVLKEGGESNAPGHH
jgi:hypothetical protein